MSSFSALTRISASFRLVLSPKQNIGIDCPRVATVVYWSLTAQQLLFVADSSLKIFGF